MIRFLNDGLFSGEECERTGGVRAVMPECEECGEVFSCQGEGLGIRNQKSEIWLPV
jgi:hypothetical protein